MALQRVVGSLPFSVSAFAKPVLASLPLVLNVPRWLVSTLLSHSCVHFVLCTFLARSESSSGSKPLLRANLYASRSMALQRVVGSLPFSVSAFAKPVLASLPLVLNVPRWLVSTLLSHSCVHFVLCTFLARSESSS